MPDTFDPPGNPEHPLPDYIFAESQDPTYVRVGHPLAVLKEKRDETRIGKDFPERCRDLQAELPPDGRHFGSIL